jgi:hypothetical protein
VTGDNGTDAERRDRDDAAYGDDADRTAAGRTDAEGRPVAATDDTAATADRPNTEYEQGREDERIEEGRTRGT